MSNCYNNLKITAFFSNLVPRRKVREISKCCRNCSDILALYLVGFCSRRYYEEHFKLLREISSFFRRIISDDLRQVCQAALQEMSRYHITLYQQKYYKTRVDVPYRGQELACLYLESESVYILSKFYPNLIKVY